MRDFVQTSLLLWSTLDDHHDFSYKVTFVERYKCLLNVFFFFCMPKMTRCNSVFICKELIIYNNIQSLFKQIPASTFQKATIPSQNSSRAFFPKQRRAAPSSNAPMHAPIITRVASELTMMAPVLVHFVQLWI